MRTTFRQFVLFAINGGLIGLLCWSLQLAFYAALNGDSNGAYWVSAVLASAIGVAINYQVQRRFIFGRDGSFVAFAIAATAMTITVSFAATGARWGLIHCCDAETANRLGYAVGALLVAPLSFTIKKFLIFRGSKPC